MNVNETNPVELPQKHFFQIVAIGYCGSKFALNQFTVLDLFHNC